MMKMYVLFIGIQLMVISGCSAASMFQFPKDKYDELYNAASGLEKPLEDFFQEVQSDASDFDVDDIEQAVESLKEGNWQQERAKREANEPLEADRRQDLEIQNNLKASLKSKAKSEARRVDDAVQALLDELM